MCKNACRLLISLVVWLPLAAFANELNWALGLDASVNGSDGGSFGTPLDGQETDHPLPKQGGPI